MYPVETCPCPLRVNILKFWVLQTGPDHQSCREDISQGGWTFIKVTEGESSPAGMATPQPHQFF